MTTYATVTSLASLQCRRSHGDQGRRLCRYLSVCAAIAEVT